jgi:hypothetical protein
VTTTRTLSRSAGEGWRSEESTAERLRFAWLVAGIFGLLTVPRLLLHELWRDEAWQWLVVAESRSFSDLFLGLSRGGGSGYLFPLLAFLVRQAWPSPRSMQLLHGLVAAAAAFAFARWAPLGRRERALFVFGYFPFYEYAVISRSYATGALLVWLACAATWSRRPALALGAALGLLFQTTVYGYILALALACGWLLDRWLHRRERSPLPWAEAVGGLILAGAGAVAGLVQLTPAAGTRMLPWRLFWDPAPALTVLRTPWRVFVPLPRPELHFWNTNVLDAWPGVETVAGLLTLALAAALLWRSKVALATFGLGTAGLFAFGYAHFPGVLRHQGSLWLLFLAALWLGGGAGFQEDLRSWHSRALLALLILHCGVGAFASWMDLRHPFSNGGAAAELIRGKGLDQHPLLGHREPPAATVALYLGRPLYSPSRKVFVTHPDWGPEQRELSEPEVRCAARELALREARDIVLVRNKELPPWEELDPAGSTHGAIEATEDYHLYRLHRERLAETAPAAQCAGEVALIPALSQREREKN